MLKGVVMISCALLCDAIIVFLCVCNNLLNNLFSLSGYLGIQIVLTLVRICGALGAVTITTCRKAITIVLSFLFFAKPFTFQYVWSGLLIVLAIYLNILSKSNKEFILYLQHIPRQIIGVLRPNYKERKNILSTV
ncbi:adenosine 3'-phospho 5'-phosphosulfate transporter 2-like isoform X1 [Lycorma delicatula]|uniref:adenosine 3'-phospho 5'-phosphosulfate transporter 2-like isoform X1 n=2 Tax=Lycorma delicatula TaxID=130591 RepID=UPI003F5189EC